MALADQFPHAIRTLHVLSYLDRPHELRPVGANIGGRAENRGGALERFVVIKQRHVADLGNIDASHQQNLVQNLPARHIENGDGLFAGEGRADGAGLPVDAGGGLPELDGAIRHPVLGGCVRHDDRA